MRYIYGKTGLGSPEACVKYFVTSPDKSSKIKIIQYKPNRDKCYGYLASQTKTDEDVSSTKGWYSLDLHSVHITGRIYKIT